MQFLVTVGLTFSVAVLVTLVAIANTLLQMLLVAFYFSYSANIFKGKQNVF